MSPQATAILTLFEALPTMEQQKVYGAIGDRFSLLTTTNKKESHLAKVLAMAKAINDNTPNSSN